MRRRRCAIRRTRWFSMSSWSPIVVQEWAGAEGSPSLSGRESKLPPGPVVGVDGLGVLGEAGQVVQLVQMLGANHDVATGIPLDAVASLLQFPDRTLLALRVGHFFSSLGMARSSQIRAAVRLAISAWRGTLARRLPFA